MLIMKNWVCFKKQVAYKQESLTRPEITIH